MAKLSRFTQKIFGSAASTDQISKFGSLFAGSPAFTTDPVQAQSLSNFLTGWFGAAIGGNAPAIEDMNAAHFVETSQLAYILQAGIPEWDAGTTYYIGSIAQNGLGVQYISIVDDNLANALTDTTKWKRSGSGALKYFNTAGAVISNGSTILKFPTLSFDTFSDYDPSSGLFTAPADDVYPVSVGLVNETTPLSVSAAWYLEVVRNGSIVEMANTIAGSGSSNTNTSVSISGLVKMSAGETLQVNSFLDTATSITLTTKLGFNQLSIGKY